MQTRKNFSLKKHNTFSIDVKTNLFAKIKTVKQCKQILEKYPDEKILILGGGSNILLTKNWDGLVLKVELKGKSFLKEDDEYIYVKAFSGENWDKFVKECVKKDLAGIENMVMIPGTVGGAVAQNIGAYGQNITDTLESIEVINISTAETKTLLPEDCGFKYRDSKFKKEWMNKFLIISATFKLKKNTKNFELSYHERAGRYGSLKEELQSFAKEPYSIQEVTKAVIKQREKRLPSVDEYGTCGSFFRNPLVTYSKYKELAKKIADLQCYPPEDLKYTLDKNGNFKDDDLVKIPAGRLLDERGWKGKWENNVGISEKHALCVITNKKASGQEILSFIKRMQKDIKTAYGIELQPEVNIIS